MISETFAGSVKLYDAALVSRSDTFEHAPIGSWTMLHPGSNYYTRFRDGCLVVADDHTNKNDPHFLAAVNRLLITGDKISAGNMKGIVHVVPDDECRGFDVVVSPQSLIKRQCVGPIMQIMDAMDAMGDEGSSTRKAEQMTMEEMCCRLRSEGDCDFSGVIDIYIHCHTARSSLSRCVPTVESVDDGTLRTACGKPSLFGEMNADMCLCYNHDELLEFIWHNSSMTPVIACETCKMLHHACSCETPISRQIMLPIETVVLDGCTTSFGMPARFDF